MLFCPKCSQEVIECTADCNVEITSGKYACWTQDMGFCENCEYIFEVVDEERYKE